MTEISGELTGWILKLNVAKDFGEFSLDSQMLKVLLALDGAKHLDAIAHETGISASDTRHIADKLFGLELVTRVQPAAACLPATFAQSLEDELSQAVGPIAGIIIEDELADMNLAVDRIPVALAAELINRLAGQVPRAEKRTMFQRNMLEALKTLM